MKNGKFTQTAVLLLSARKRIREGGKTDGFYIIMHRIFEEYDNLICEKLSNSVTQEQLEKRRAFLYWTSQLVSIIAQAGKDLDKYIQAHSDVPHSEVPHVEVFARVSSILKEYGFCPKEECIDTLNLRPYNWTIRELHYKGHTDATIPVVKKKAVRNKVLRGWDPKYTRRKFFPWWRSVLGARCLSYAAADYRSVLDLGQLRNRCSDSMSKGSSSNPAPNIGFLGRIQNATSTHQSRRFSIASFRMLAKVL